MKATKAIRTTAAALLIAAFLPTVAFADNITAYIDKGNVTVTATADNVGNVDYYDAAGAYQSGGYGVGDTITVTQTDSSTPTTNRVVVDTANGNAVDIVLKDVNIKLAAPTPVEPDPSKPVPTPGPSVAPVLVKGDGISGGTVTVELDGSNTLDASAVDTCAGLQVTNNSTVVIQDANADGGSLTATGGENGAGVGTGKGEWGNVTVESGAVNATGGEGGAGVGSGYYGNSMVNISGGSVTAVGGDDAAGIGSGHTGPGGVNISGGTVNATGGSNGAGIDTGTEGVSTVTITGGNITANAQPGAEAVGAGLNGSAATYITGGTVNGTNYPVKDNGVVGSSEVHSYSSVLAPGTAFKICDMAGKYTAYTAMRDKDGDALSADEAQNRFNAKSHIDGDKLIIETEENNVQLVFSTSTLKALGVSHVVLKNGDNEVKFDLEDYSGEVIEAGIEGAEVTYLTVDGVRKI